MRVECCIFHNVSTGSSECPLYFLDSPVVVLTLNLEQLCSIVQADLFAIIVCLVDIWNRGINGQAVIKALIIVLITLIKC